MGKSLKSIRRPNRRETLRGNLGMNLFPARLAQRERRGPSSVVQGLLPVCPPLILPQALQTSASAWAVTSSQSRGLAAPLGAGLRAALRRWRALHPAWPLPVSPSCLTLLELARIAVPRSHVFCGVLPFVCLSSAFRKRRGWRLLYSLSCLRTQGRRLLGATRYIFVELWSRSSRDGEGSIQLR